MNLPKIPLDGNAPFDNPARLYRDAGLHPVPCEDKAANRIRWKGIRRPPGDKFLSALVTKYGGDNIGILTGRHQGRCGLMGRRIRVARSLDTPQFC